MYNLKLISVVILLGSVLFLIAAFMPYSRVYTEKDPEKKMDIIMGAKLQYDLAHVLFPLGALLTAFGLAFMVSAFRDSPGSSWAWIGAGILILGSMLWSWHCMERLRSPATFVNGETTPYLFLAYSILTMAGLVLLGIFLLKTDVPGWVGWMLLCATALLAVLGAVFRDMPPFVYYVLTLVLAIKMLNLEIPAPG